jgi:hypothetical protein
MDDIKLNVLQSIKIILKKLKHVSEVAQIQWMKDTILKS